MKTKILFTTILSLIIHLSKAQWQQTSELNSCSALATNGTNLFAGTYGSGIFLSMDNGTTWKSINNGLTRNYIKALTTSGSSIYAGTDSAGVFLSTNNGSNWTEINKGIPKSDQVFALIVSGNNLLAGTNDSIYISTDNGANWVSHNTGLTSGRIESFAQSGNNLIAGTYGQGIFLSTNNGTSWTQTGMTNHVVYSIVTIGTNLFASTQDAGVFISTDNGAIWTAVNTGLTNLYVNALGVSGTNLLAGTQGSGVFLSSNNGGNWTAINKDTVGQYIYAFASTPTNVFAGGNNGVSVASHCNLSFLITVSHHDVACKTGKGDASVTMSGGKLPYTYSWSDGQTTATATNLAPSTYSITVTDSTGCKNSSSVTIPLPLPPNAPSICMVTTDSLSQHNIIIWEKTIGENVDSFIVYRETKTNNYNQIGAIPFSALSQFVDTVAAKYFPFSGDPNSGTYRYKLKVRDTCGNYSALSPYHNTIFTTQTGGTFNWNQYEIEGQSIPIPSLNAYILYRDDNSTGAFHQINAVSGSQTSVTDPNYLSYPNASWRVETNWGISCTPTAKTTNTFSTSKSNIKGKGITGIKEDNDVTTFKMYPNPSSGKLFIESNSLKKQLLQVFDVTGKLMLAQNVENGENQIDASSLPQGVYNVCITNNERLANKRMVILE